MITKLYVRNYALIEELEIRFESGFSSITGETGAGKSILLGAMGLALGERADMRSALDAAEKCVVELTVCLDGYGLQDLFEEHDLDYADETILRREILPSGKSRAFVNDTPALVAALNAIAARIIDIHSQNETILLRDPAFQLNLIDGMAGNGEQRRNYSQSYRAWKKAVSDLDALLAESTSGRDMDYERFLLDELVEARLESADEEGEIEEELQRLQHVEDVASSLGDSDRLLSDSGGISERMDLLTSSLSSASKYDTRAAELLDRLKSVQIEIRDIQNELESLNTSLEADPERLRILDDRMGQLQHLKSKHRVPELSDLIKLREEIGERLRKFEDIEESLELARSQADLSFAELERAAETLTNTRNAVLPEIEGEIGKLLTRLNMPEARILMELSSEDKPGPSGSDQLRWMFSANAGRSTQPLEKVASGGELSRVMLALKAIMSRSRGLPTIIFDEIDTGISGETARRVADILRSMGAQMQVIAITHLPQIAAAARHHYLVEKQNIDSKTRTLIRRLSDDERVEEISRILSGSEATDAARANARELLAEE